MLLLAAAAACGESLEPGNAEIDGQVAGRSVTPLTAFMAVHPLGATEVIIMSESSELGCDLPEEDNTGLVAVIGFPCGSAEVTTYPLGSVESELDCLPERKAFMIVEGFAEVSEYDALSGSVTITRRDSEVIAGSFDGDFGDNGALSGEFVAMVCPQ